MPVIKFAMAIAFTSSIWVLVTQTDKLVLSGILPLAEYGNFTLAVLAASAVMLISGPVSSALMPRMARLNAEGNQSEMIKVYRTSTELVTIVCGSAALTIAFNAEGLMYAWTGSFELAAETGPILRLYVIGNGFLVLSAFPYYLQYAMGNLRYHVAGNLLTLCVLIPGIVLGASLHGAIGAGWVWLSLHASFLMFWVGYVHGKLCPGLHFKWIYFDVAKVAAPVLLMLGALHIVGLPQGGRAMSILLVSLVGVLALSVAIFVSSYRNSFWSWCSRFI